MKQHRLPMTPRGRGLVVDLFAGGGGASAGIEAALGEPVDVAVNHDATAIAVHEANHPSTTHYRRDVYEVRPRDATGGLPVDVLWASPDCTHHSRAKGGRPRSQGIRALAWVVVDWAREARPRVIFLENVPEFRDWGPLGADDKPLRERAGETFAEWSAALAAEGYAVEHRVLDAADFGAPTRRRRLFVVARRDGEPIVWPTPTHGPGRAQPWRSAAEIIDWSIPCPSIFERKRPLAEKTLWRIAEGIRRYVIESAAPFIVQVNHGRDGFRGGPLGAPLSTVTATQRGHAVVAPAMVRTDMHQSNSRCTYDPGDPLRTITSSGGHAVAAATLVQTGYGERPGQTPRALDLEAPLGTVVAGGAKAAVVQAFLAKHYGDPRRKTGGGVVIGQELDRPIGTVTARDHHSLAQVVLHQHLREKHGRAVGLDGKVSAVRAFLTAYYGTGVGQPLGAPARTITARHRLGLVTVEGADYQIVDIGLRMLEPHELLRAQFGVFADGYDLTPAKTKTAQVRLIGNSVCPAVARALVESNVGSLRARRAA